jgi:hypothetical protein
MQILSANEMPKRRKHYGCAAIMRFLSASESPETQKILRMRSDNANFECQRKRRNTENTTDPQRECEFAIFAKPPKTKKHYGIAVKMRISYLRKASQSQKTLWDRSENANFLSSQSRPKPKNTMGSQWKCEFPIFAKPPKTKKHYGIAAKMQISYLRRAAQSQKTLWDHSENANFTRSQMLEKPKTTMGSQR